MTAMNARYKITRIDAEGKSTLTLDECQSFFATQSDFQYYDSFGASQDGVHMKITGHFFMWQVENGQIPFRFYDGDLYVAIPHPIVFDKMKEVARGLEANYIEG